MSLLDHVQIYTPLLHVNSEARAIARKWGQRVSIPPRDRITGNQSEDVSSRKEICPFSRPFDINRDYLYLVPDNIVDLILGASDRLEQPDMNGKATRVVFSLPTVVLSEEVIWLKDAELMEEILDLCSILGLVYIVVGEQPKWKRGGVQRWWGVEWVAKRAFVWQWMENRFVEMGGGSRFESEEVYRRMVDWCGCMGRVLKRDHKTRFEVRVVRAVKQ
ncbi:hypothetical protein AbraCBS73388_002957 [Aspergillus brasiliensis]|uniref:Uncharacterized protein n=1 Tax=Aspergillus brasiliensis TaxID=319629 RepID=A0A9W6DTA3_9EURO|nr:hypothetical protein AbraCBS73388_002957 [Aspergillus brasiliensis]